MKRCLYCGRILRQKCDTIYKDTEKWRPLPKTCTMGVYEQCGGKIVARGVDKEGRPWGECESCGMEYSAYSRVRKIVSRTPRAGLYGSGPGDYGDGFFCGQRCGLAFAVIAARSGVRLKSEH